MKLLERIRLYFRDRKWRKGHEEWIDTGEGYETDYDYATSVASRYRGPLLPSDDYVAAREQIEKGGIASLIPERATDRKEH